MRGNPFLIISDTFIGGKGGNLLQPTGKTTSIIFSSSAARSQAISSILSVIDEFWRTHPFVFMVVSYDFGALLHFITHPRPANDPLVILVGFDDLTQANLTGPCTSISVHSLKPLMPDHEFIHAVKPAIQHMQEGEFYVINISRPYVFRHSGSPLSAFYKLMRCHPSPYSFYLKTPQITLVSNSPELFVKISGSEICAQPMKGTRPASDKAGGSRLSVNPKEQAENLMIVDLFRSDLGKICTFGSVSVEALWTVKQYASVFQMTSTIKGTLKPGVHLSDMLTAAFPSGSVTGAPKRRVMQEIALLESLGRGFYCGSAFLKSPGGDVVSSVLIRTALFYPDGKGRYHAGAGITVESIPEKELEELQWKLQPVIILQQSGSSEVVTL